MDILIIDDEGNLRRMLRALLEGEGYSVREAESAEEGIGEVEREVPEAILLDLMLPGISGLEALPRIGDLAPGVPVVMMSGKATLGDAVRATRLGAFHFIEKPLTPEAVLLTVQGALEVSRARDLSRALREELGPEAELVGRSPGINRVRELIQRVAPTEARVLITGESGTGKELVASAIHALSRRKGRAFVRVNSAAIPKDLVESEMFGHERGAFTGATERRRGRFELAHRGTLFLDEVGDLGPEAQSKLLRAIETGVVERVGGAKALEVDVRVLAATNHDLRGQVEEGSFRQDLLFRLEVVPIHLPPLRERMEDLPLLVAHTLKLLRKRNGLPTPNLTPKAMDALHRYPWPGNVRELMNILERLAILSPGDPAGTEDVVRLLPVAPPGADATPGYQEGDPRPLRDRLDDYERALIQGALDGSAGNVAEAGRRLQTDRPNLYRRMKRLGLRTP
ncbi:MAG: sigma-54-dependent Fis family transcriptional regulator [Gemmatimonadetes bacterium]|nr:sigma-54 dependent transcriptional regulator [Gemmatimonadota bacterium]NNM06531.1 sigma-54-dependent Fis family transcriptional regulator [Gemmatimonadota bacterium]